MREFFYTVVTELISKTSSNIRSVLVACTLVCFGVYLSYYTSIQNFNEIQKQWEKYNNNPNDMKYSSLYWQYPICKENLLYKLGLEFLSPHDRMIQTKSCIVIEHCYEDSIGKGASDKVDCSDEKDAIRIAIASM